MKRHFRTLVDVMKARSFFYGKSILVFLYISTTDFAFSTKPSYQDSGRARGGSLIGYKKIKPISHFHPTWGQKKENTGGVSLRESQNSYIENLLRDSERRGENKIEHREVQTANPQDLPPLLREAIAPQLEKSVQRPALDAQEPDDLHWENRRAEDETLPIETLKEDVWEEFHLQAYDLNEEGLFFNKWENTASSKGNEEEEREEESPDAMVPVQDTAPQTAPQASILLPPLEGFVEPGSLTIFPTLDAGFSSTDTVPSSTDAGDVKKIPEEGDVLNPEVNQVTERTEKPDLISPLSHSREVCAVKKEGGIWQKVKGAVYHIFGSSQDKEDERLEEVGGVSGTEGDPKSPRDSKEAFPEEAQNGETESGSSGPESKGTDPDPYLTMPPSREDYLNGDLQEQSQQAERKDAAELKIIVDQCMAYVAPAGSVLLESYRSGFYVFSCMLYVLFMYSKLSLNLAG